MGLILGAAPQASLSPQLLQGALSGGGFNKFISMSDDGLTKVINYDGANAWIWNDSTSQWDLALSQSRVPGSAYNAAYRDWGRLDESDVNNAAFYTTASIVVAPSDKDRLYAIVWSFPRYSTPGRIWKSTDRAQSWTDTGFSVTPALQQSAVNVGHGYGAIMAVDPVNPDIVLVSGAAGDIWKTTDGFNSVFDSLSGPGQPLDGSVAYVNVNSVTSASTFTITCDAVPDAVTHKNDLANRSMFFSNLTTPSSIKGYNYLASSTATTLTSAFPADGTINVNDKVMVGEAGIIAFDRSTSIPGDHTPGVYIGWGYGASAVWHSDDGGATWSETTSGGPATILSLAVSINGDLFAVDNIAQAAGAWSYIDGSWVNLSISSSISNPFNSVTCDLTNSDRVAFCTLSSDLKVSVDGGATFFSPTSPTLRSAGDTSWMSKAGTLEDSMTNGMIQFDPQVSGKLWVVEGIGAHTTTCPSSGSDTVTWTAQNKNQQGFIVDQIIKPPSNPLVMVGQDRIGFRIADVTQEPTEDDAFRGNWLTVIEGYIDDGSGGGTYSGVAGNKLTVTSLVSGNQITNCIVTDIKANIGLHTGKTVTNASPVSENVYSVTSNLAIAPTTLYLTFNAPINHAWGIDHAKDDPSFLVLCSSTYVWKSSDAGLNWLRCTQPTGANSGGAVAAQSATSFVWFPANNGTPSYTADGGQTWNPCLFNGSSITGGWSFYLYLNRHIVCADWEDAATFYAYNYSATDGVGGLWISTDGGANWSLQSGSKGACGTAAGDDFTLSSVNGHQGHLLVGTGEQWSDHSHGVWSGDAGVTWHDLPGMDIVWHAAAGKTAPDALYPSIYVVGVPSISTDATQTPGAFRTDTFDPNNPTNALTWIRYEDPEGHTCPSGNMDAPKTLCADWDEYGTFYGGFAGTGYFCGKLAA